MGKVWIFKNSYLKKKKNTFLFTWLHLVFEAFRIFFFFLWHAGSLGVAWELLVAACGIKFPEQGWNLSSLY